MTTGLSTANAANPLLDALLRGVAFHNDNAYMQLHTADPGSAGTANVSVVTSRQLCTISAAAAGLISMSSTPAFLMTATETISHITLWSASSAGLFITSAALLVPRPVVNGDILIFNQLSMTLVPLAA